MAGDTGVSRSRALVAAGACTGSPGCERDDIAASGSTSGAPEQAAQSSPDRMETIPKSLVRRIGHLPDSRYQSIAQGRTPPESGEEPRKHPRRRPGLPVLPGGIAPTGLRQLAILPGPPPEVTVPHKP